VVIAQRADDDAPSDRDGAELDGLVSALMSAIRFVVAGVTVDASAAGASGSAQLGAKLSGYTGSLRVEGMLSADRTLLLVSRISFNN